ncbi:MAG: tetratricopeptide repeat protein [Roseiflexaceae bacterium]|nr:tetratricopeptide repeat protein [Roseiflexaceae bacterium]
MIDLRLLGPIEISVDGVALKVDSRKALALLGYLAVARRPAARTALLGLLWAEMPEDRGRANLSWTLNRLNALLPGFIQADRNSVRLANATPLAVDLHQFDLYAASDDEQAQALALSLYGGPLLEGLYLTACPEFEYWLLVERERNEQRLLALIQRHADLLERRGALAEAADVLTRLLAIDPLQEQAHRQRMSLLARSGQRGAALAQFESCQRALAGELGVEPEQATVALVEAIRAGAVQRSGAPLAVPGLIEAASAMAYAAEPALRPAPVPLLIGRQLDLDAITGLLTNPACRMVTVTGVGGVGKTTLALACAQRVAALFRDGVRVVALVALDGPTLLPAALADALGIDLHSHFDPRRAVLDALAGRELLLVLDNFEQLVEAADLLEELLATAPAVTLLLTSQERIRLREEWVYDLTGLTVPLGESMAEVEASAAARLFVQQAQRLRASFTLNDSNCAAIARICTLVGGHPLAIELAAAWVRTLSCAEIARELAAGLDLLTSQVRNLPPRHRSVRAAFEQSWARLGQQERSALSMLAVFPGSFSLEAASAVMCGQQNEALMLALVDRSLLARLSGGRYEMHGLVRSFAMEKLDAAAIDRVRASHWAFFQRLLQAEQPRLRSADAAARVRVDDDLQNIRSGLLWALQQPAAVAVESALDSLLLFFDTSGAFRAGVELFTQCAALLADAAPGSRAECVAGRLMTCRGLLLLWLARYDDARVAFARSQRIAQACGDAQQEALSTGGLAFTLRWLGQFAEAEQLARAALAQARALDDGWLTAMLLQYLALICRDQGQHSEAREAALECLARFGDYGYRRGMGFALTVLGLVAHDLHDLDAAERYFEEGLRLCVAVGDPMGAVMADFYLGRLEFLRGQFGAARRRLDRGVASAGAIGYQWGVLRAQTLLGMIDDAEGEHATARTRLGDAARAATELGATFLAKEAAARLREIDARAEG